LYSGTANAIAIASNGLTACFPCASAFVRFEGVEVARRPARKLASGQEVSDDDEADTGDKDTSRACVVA
jgi:hypothetical protein